MRKRGCETQVEPPAGFHQDRVTDWLNYFTAFTKAWQLIILKDIYIYIIYTVYIVYIHRHTHTHTAIERNEETTFNGDL